MAPFSYSGLGLGILATGEDDEPSWYTQVIEHTSITPAPHILSIDLQREELGCSVDWLFDGIDCLDGWFDWLPNIDKKWSKHRSKTNEKVMNNQ